MNLNARERRALRSIEGGLAESNPELVARFASLSRLMAPKDRLPGSRRRRHTRAHSRSGRAVLALWLAVSCALIATAVALSHPASGGPCNVLVVHCDHQAPASPAQPGAR
jgi:hypothetical protein